MGQEAVDIGIECEGEDYIRPAFAESVETQNMRHIVYCDAIVELLAFHFDIPSREIRARNRGVKSIARVRQIGMYAAHVVLGINMTEVGEGFGRDKSTVVHACHLVEDLRDDEEFDAIVARFETLAAAAFKFSSVSPKRGVAYDA